MDEARGGVNTDRLVCLKVVDVAGGAQRSEKARQAILAAALEITAELGYERASIEAFARRAGSSKQTIYRWWSSKAAVLQEALENEIRSSTGLRDTGDPVADVRAQMTGVIGFFTDPRLGAVFRGLLAAAQSDPDVAESALRSLFGPRRRAVLELLDRAAHAGRLSGTADRDLVVDLLYGPLYYRLLVTRDPLTAEYVDQVVDAVLGPLAVGQR
ncbi:TetR/AcrR family transcriptional regulator [Pseudonocardia lacus]|uniref:TetR/AcrR family transcriptional regulator n=1 Tax=Pseudonocardia lacus TaxID=2835865 RepID=UPI001BDD985E|nr:TetR/AcrR family transcriptional regulator [Pseudonocardia lacus]